MRRLILTENITLDGVIDASGGWFGPGGSDPDADESDILEELKRQMAEEQALLLGRVTFEELRGYWPAHAGEPDGIGDHLNAVPKYVVSRTLGDPAWANTTVLRGRVEDEVRALKAGAGGPIGMTGSVTLARTLTAAGLIDEYRLFVYPVVLGGGARLFPDGTALPRLEPVQTERFRSGVVLLRYRVGRG
ncbi:dihydrofolate reductase family protein [Nocardiopsis composta]|uniref:Dihydrofolate reductase n=1 Tax=Nocardiopsis composta TaxID=157465 RepID=A0A7W8VF86_9ACTN|nr:dihydrofolate reductase family protein [Nocardiopsis composta]MBB5433868.1 dihydrofolate reductase [Nocardiopsis composta]